MFRVRLNANQLPLVNEAGFLTDKQGTFTHLTRTLDQLHVFIFVTAGTIYVTENDSDYTLQAGDYLFLHANQLHSGKRPFEPHTSWYYLHFYKQAPLADTPLEVERAAFMTPLDYYDKYLRLPKTGHIEKAYLITALFDQLLKSKREGSVKQSIDAYQLLYAIYQQHQKLNNDTQPLIDHVYEVIEATRGKATSKDFSEALHLNYSYLSTVFKQTTGQTIQQAKNSYLIEQAIKLFRYESLNVTEVSDRLQFANPYYFSRVFKQVTGFSPTQYLKQQ